MPDWLLSAIFSALASGAATFAAVNVKLAWLRADIDRAHRRIDQLEKELPCP